MSTCAVFSVALLVWQNEEALCIPDVFLFFNFLWLLSIFKFCIVPGWHLHLFTLNVQGRDAIGKIGCSTTLSASLCLQPQLCNECKGCLECPHNKHYKHLMAASNGTNSNSWCIPCLNNYQYIFLVYWVAKLCVCCHIVCIALWWGSGSMVVRTCQQSVGWWFSPHPFCLIS